MLRCRRVAGWSPQRLGLRRSSFWGGQQSPPPPPPQGAYQAAPGHQGQQFPYPYTNQTPPADAHHYAPPEVHVHEVGRAPASSSWRSFAGRLLRFTVAWCAMYLGFALFGAPTTALGNARRRGHWPLLVAKEEMWDPMFRDSVVLLTDVGVARGAQGIVLNKPAMGPLPDPPRDVTAQEGSSAQAGPPATAARVGPGMGPVLRGENLPSGQSWLVSQELAKNPVFIGGPLSLDASQPLVVHGVPGVPGAVEALPGLFVGGDHRALRRKILAGVCDPEEVLLVMGFSGWGIGQLQHEFRRGSWSGAVVSHHKVEDVKESTDAPTADVPADTTARSLLRAMNKSVNDCDSPVPPAGGSSTDEAAATAPRIKRDALDAALAAMISQQYMGFDAAASTSLPTPPTQGSEDAVRPASGSMPPPAPHGASDAEVAEAARLRAEWLRDNFEMTRIPDDATHARVKRTLTSSEAPLFGYQQRATAASMRANVLDCINGGVSEKCPTDGTRGIQVLDYIPPVPAILTEGRLRSSS